MNGWDWIVVLLVISNGINMWRIRQMRKQLNMAHGVLKDHNEELDCVCQILQMVVKMK